MEVISRSDTNLIDKIASVLISGGVVVLPTDTSYGICANAFNEDAVSKIRKIKNRDNEKPLSVFVRDLNYIEKISRVDIKIKKELKRYLPGAYTFVLKSQLKKLSHLSQNKKIGIRVIDHEIINLLLNVVDFPITATSANISGESPIYSFDILMKVFKNQKHKPDLVVDAGELEKNIPSTVVDLTSNKSLVIRRGLGKV